MDEIDEILAEFGTNCEDLYKLHTGHRIHEKSDDSDENSTSSSAPTLSHLEPPLFTYEEIEQNLVVIEPDPDELEVCSSPVLSNLGEENHQITKSIQELLENDEKDSLHGRSSELAQCLSELITPTYCHICNKQADGHYDFAGHYKKVFKWLRVEMLTRNLPELDLRMFFCEMCNVVLSGDATAQNHYEESSHQQKATYFCVQCLQKIDVSICEHMLTHITDSNKENVLTEQQDTPNENVHTEQQDTFKENVLTEHQDRPKGNQIFKNSKDQKRDATLPYQTVTTHKPSSATNVVVPPHPNINGLGHVDSLKTIDQNIGSKGHVFRVSRREGLEQENKACELKDYTSLAQYILNMLTSTFCYICNSPAADHYSTHSHNKTFLKWILKNSHIIELFRIDYVESLVCFACRAIFFNSVCADIHYASEEHKRNFKYFCEFCMVYDENTKNHKDHKQVISEELIRSLYSDKAEKNKKIAVLKNRENLNANISVGPGRIIATELILMLTPIFCYVCQKSVNVHSLSNHYLEKDHIMMVRQWLSVEIRKFGVNIDPNLIFCEACNLELCGTDLAIKHYQMAFHISNQQMYCPVCIVRGPSEVIFQHFYSWEHQYNYETLHLMYKQNNIYSTTNYFNQGTSFTAPLSEGLAKTVTSTHCKLCDVQFQSKEEADIHYWSESHQISVNIWFQLKQTSLPNTGVNSELLISGGRTNQQNLQIELVKGSQDKVQKSNISTQGNLINKCDANLVPEISTKCHENRSNPGCKKILEKTKPPIRTKNILDDLNDLNNIDPKNLLIKKNILSNDTTLPVLIIKLPTSENNSTEEIELYKLVNKEVEELLKQVYCLKPVPIESSLIFLRKLNKEITNIKKQTFNNDNKDVTIENSDCTKPRDKSGIHSLFKSNIFSRLAVRYIFDMLFTGRTAMRVYEGNSVTQFNLQKKKLLYNEKQNTTKIKNSKCDNDISSAPIPDPVSRANTNWRCVIL